MFALLLALQAPVVHVDGRLVAMRGLIVDTLLAVAESSKAGEVVVSNAISWRRRGMYEYTARGWRVTVASATDEFALLHEFGHHYNAVEPMAYYDWVDSMGLHPNRDHYEQFADAFANAIMALRHSGGVPPTGKRPHEHVARRLARRRPFRRRDEQFDPEPY